MVEDNPSSPDALEMPQDPLPKLRQRRGRKPVKPKVDDKVKLVRVKVSPFYCPEKGCKRGKGKKPFTRPDLLKNHLQNVHSTLWGLGMPKHDQLKGLLKGHKGPQRMFSCQECGAHVTNMHYHRKACTERKKLFEQSISASVTTSQPDAPTEEYQKSSKARMKNLLEPFRLYMSEIKSCAKNTTRNYVFAIRDFLLWNEQHSEVFKTNALFTFQQDLPAFSLYASCKEIDVFKRKTAYFAYKVFAAFLRNLIGEKLVNVMSRDVVSQLYNHLDQMVKLADTVGAGLTKKATDKSSRLQYEAQRKNESLKLKAKETFEIMQKFLASETVAEDFNKYLRLPSLSTDSPNQVRNFLEAILLVSSCGQRSDVIRNMTKDEFQNGEHNGKEGEDAVLVVKVFEHKTKNSKLGAASLPVIGSSLIELLERSDHMTLCCKINIMTSSQD